MLFAMGFFVLLIACQARSRHFFAWIFRSRTLDADNATLIYASAMKMVSERRGTASHITSSAPRATFGTRR
jgi:hypothetical protein